MTSWKDAALVIAGHGSTLNGDSNVPTYQHADTIRERGLFAEVHETFWKEEPNFRNVLRQVEARTVYIVPNFISAGYFTEQVLPREFQLAGPRTERGGRDIFYCEPVGLHESMTSVLLSRAEACVQATHDDTPGWEKETCVVICGHGTNLNENSTKIIEEQVTRIKASGRFLDAQGMYMEEAPFIKDWQTLTHAPRVVAVPFFISDGLHSFEDIPVLFGFAEQGHRPTTQPPYVFGEQRLWYASAIGTEPHMADVILAQVQKYDDAHRNV
jgi:sirohydrochlorin cobaltochelatase